MPQMSPLMWMILFFYFFVIYILFNLVIYYYKYYVFDSSLKSIQKIILKSFKFKW